MGAVGQSGDQMAKGSFTELLVHLHPRSVPESSAKIGYTWCMGGLSAWMFLLEAVTGALLMLYYIPSLTGAYPSVQNITHAVPYGFFVRNLHYWCGQVMVITVALHMIRVCWTGSYKRPRHFNWIVGVSLLVSDSIGGFLGLHIGLG